MTRLSQQPGYILRLRPFTESSSLIDVFSRNHGILRLIGKGVKRKHSPHRGLMMPFLRLQLSWSGKSDLPTLTHSEEIGCSPSLKAESWLSGNYLNELLLALLISHDAHPSLYDAYEQALQSLSDDTCLHFTLRRFEKILLREIGYGLVLDHAVDTGLPICNNKTYNYIPNRGPVERYGLDESGIPASGDMLLHLLHDEPPSSMLVRTQCRDFIRAILHYNLPKPNLQSALTQQEIAAFRRRYGC